ncbi:hypothetical protein U1Q18_040991, partial [Sarracenia purpurea var. burkii]
SPDELMYDEVMNQLLNHPVSTCWIWISPARGSTQGRSAQGKGGDVGVAKVRAAGQRSQRRRSR